MVNDSMEGLEIPKQELGLLVPQDSLPTRCPRCENLLDIHTYVDWVYCPVCLQGRSRFEFDTWEVPEELQKRKTAYMVTVVQPRQEAETFWELATRTAAHEVTVYPLTMDLHDFVGTVNANDLASFSSKTAEIAGKARHFNVIRLEDAARRLTGFALIYSTGQGLFKVESVLVTPGPRVAFLRSGFNQAVVVDSLMTALQLLRTHSIRKEEWRCQWPPIVFADLKNQEDWVPHIGTALVIATSEPLPHILKAAARAKCLVATLPFMEVRIGKMATVSWVKSVFDISMPWFKAAALWMEQMSSIDAVRLLRQAKLGAAELELILDHCPQHVGARIKATESVFPTQVTLGSKTICDTGSSWVDKRGQTILSVSFHIEMITKDWKSAQESDERRSLKYLCLLTREDGEKLEFVCGEVLERDTFRTIFHHAAANGWIVHFNPSYNSVAWQAALQLHPPKKELNHAK